MDLKCPICNVKNQKASLGVNCENCGFDYSFINTFANKTSYDLWQKKIVAHKNKLIQDIRIKLCSSNRFILGSDYVAYISDDNRMNVINEYGESELCNVIQFSYSERNKAVLEKGGIIRPEGDNTYGQLNKIETYRAKHVLCAPSCIYIVNQSEQVDIFGVVIDPEIKKWEHITMLVCGSFHVLGLTRDHTVRVAGEMMQKSIIEKVSSWKNVKSICASTDCSIALHNDGTVSFAGRPNDPRSKVEEWKDIIDIKADTSYVVGLKSNGSIQLAGTCKDFLDMGRSSAVDWKDVIAITCSKTGIAAIFSDGSLRIVGGFIGDLETIYKKWNEYVKFNPLKQCQ